MQFTVSPVPDQHQQGVSYNNIIQPNRRDEIYIVYSNSACYRHIPTNYVFLPMCTPNASVDTSSYLMKKI